MASRTSEGTLEDWVVARKPHPCTGWRCWNTIRPGERYRRVVMPPHAVAEVANDQWLTAKLCSTCRPVRADESVLSVIDPAKAAT